MVIYEFLRLMRLRTTVLLTLVLIIVLLLSFSVTKSTQIELVEQLDSNADDLNIEALESRIDNFSVVNYYFEFWYLSDYINSFLIILLVWSGATLAMQNQYRLQSGHGNMMVVRSTYRKQVNVLLISQSLCIATVITFVFVTLIPVAYYLCGNGFKSFYLNGVSYGFADILCLGVLHLSSLILCVVFINAIGLLCNHFVKNLIFIQCIPSVVLCLLPFIICSVIIEIFPNFLYILSIFVPFVIITNMLNILYDTNSIFSIILFVAPYLSYLLIFTKAYKNNLREIEGNYI